MSVLRFDYSTSDWVIFAPLRRLRPHLERHGTPPEQASGESIQSCPFCRGNEALTPREVYAVRNGAAAGDWLVRVVPNKFPALQIEEDHRRREEGPLFGNIDFGHGAKLQVEFVSANPVGPIHVGNGRGLALGDTLARALSAAGYEVQRGASGRTL